MDFRGDLENALVDQGWSSAVRGYMAKTVEEVRRIRQAEALLKERTRLLNNADGGLSGDWYRKEAAKITEQLKQLGVQ
jgi:hypothetical protein